MTAEVTDDYTGKPLWKIAPPRPEESEDARRVKGTLWKRVAEQNLNLDPKPFVAWGVRYATQIGSAYFEPGPEYSQDRTQYDVKEA